MTSSKRPLPSYSGHWTEKQLRHLLVRTLFGVTQADIAYFKGKSLPECIDILLRPLSEPIPSVFRSVDDHDLPAGVSAVRADYDPKKEFDRTLFQKADWVGQMMNPQRNIREKMVLFWHNHFVVQFNTVLDSRYEYIYIRTLRKHATGNFKSLLNEITTTPAMLVYLNGNLNNKTNSNENYGRELQELFTIGKGPNSHYTETDVKAAAKVLTGWKDDKRKITSYFDPNAHNTADKKFSEFYDNHVIKGRSGSDGSKETQELIDMISSRDEVSKFLCRKLYRWFVHHHIDEQVENDVIGPLAEVMRQSKYELKPVLTALLSGAFFYNPALIGGMFKSPADYFVGAIRELNLEIRKNMEAWFLVSEVLMATGQDIGNPPSVAGWPAYYEFPYFDKNWVNSENLAQRNKYKDFSFDGFNPPDNPFIVADFLAFADSLHDTGNPVSLTTAALSTLCAVMPGKNQISYLQSLLEIGKNIMQPWATLWSAYKKQPNAKVRKEINDRLHVFFNALLSIPEYQIM